MTALGLKEMGKFLWEGRKMIGHVGCLSLAPKVAIVHWESAKKDWYYEKWVGRHASFPPRQFVKKKFFLETLQ